MRLAAYAVLAVSLWTGCGGGSTEAPPWTRPGLSAYVRPEWGPPQPGDPAPDFELPTTGPEGTYRLSARRGRWVIVHFTTTWCPFCDEEVEHLDRLAGDYAERNVEVLLIDVLEEPDHWRSYLEGRLPVGALVSLMDVDGGAARRYAPPGFNPDFEERAHVVLAATLIVDPEGIIRLFLLTDSRDFDPTFAAVRRELDLLLEGPSS